MRILAFDIGGTSIKYGIINENFEITESHNVPTDAKKGGKALIDKVVEIIKTYDSIDRVGISTAGQVDSKSGVVVYSTDNIPNYTGTAVKNIIEAQTSIPTYVENDVNSAAIGEAEFGAARGYDEFVCLTYGTGIGGAIYLNGNIYKGSASSAGEFGHMMIHANGKPCTCGGSGCYESYASAGALLRTVNSISDRPLDGFSVFQKENFEKPEIRAEIDKWIDEIIAGLINIIYIFNPPLIVMGGGIMNEDYIIDTIRSKIYGKLMDNFRNVKIVRAENGNNSGMLGAAYCASTLNNAL